MNLYCTQRTESVAQVRVAASGAARWSGQLRGPYCRHARTLPTAHAFDADGAATVVDPCYWTPRLPFTYRVELQCQQGESPTATETFQWGLRRCETQRGDLRLDGRRYVIRAIENRTPDVAALPAWRGSEASLLVRNPSDELCREASELGVLVVADLGGASEPAAEVLRLVRHPAVHVVVLPADAAPAAAACGDVLPACALGSDDASIPSWARLVFCEEAAVARAQQATAGRLPILVRRCGAAATPTVPREDCDRLQRDLAARGQFAGYLVSLHDG
jgi:hypothetical protein